MNQDERYDEPTYEEPFDFNQGYDVPTYEEPAYAEADPHQVYTEVDQAFAPEAAPAAPGPAERRVPQAPPGEVYESAYDEDEEYDDDEEYIDDDDDFPEPGPKKAKAEGKKGASPVVLAAAALGGVGLVGTMFFLDPLGLGLSEYTEPIVAMLPGTETQEEMPAEPPMADSAEWQEPATAKRDPEPPPMEAEAPPAAKPKPPAAKPKPAEPVAEAEPPAPAAKPKAKPPAPAAKPKPVAAAPAAAKPAAGPQIKTVVAFAPNSAWVAAAEVEKLWAFSSRIQGQGGHLTIEGYAGYEKDALDLSRRRAEYVAQMLKKNNVGTRYTIDVKALGRQAGGGPRVNVTYSSKL